MAAVPVKRHLLRKRQALPPLTDVPVCMPESHTMMLTALAHTFQLLSQKDSCFSALGCPVGMTSAQQGGWEVALQTPLI